MTKFTIEVPDDVADRVAAVAVEQGVPPEELAARAVTDSFRPRRRLSFIAVGRSGHSDTSERHKEIISAGVSLRGGTRS